MRFGIMKVAVASAFADVAGALRQAFECLDLEHVQRSDHVTCTDTDSSEMLQREREQNAQAQHGKGPSI